MKVNEEEKGGKLLTRVQALEVPPDDGGLSARPVLGDTGRQGQNLRRTPACPTARASANDARGNRQPPLNLLRKNRRQ